MENTAQNPAADMNSEFDLQDSMSTNLEEPAKEVEQPIDEVVETKKDPFSSKFAALSKKEKMLRQREKELEAKFAELEQKSAPASAPKVDEVPLELRLKKDPFGTLKELGFSYDKLAEIASADGKLPQDMQMELMRQEIEDKYSKKINELESKFTENDKKREEERHTQVIENFKSEITEFTASSEDYELIQANNSSDLVYEVIEQHHAETGQVLSIKEAADYVEAYLFEENKKLLERSKKLKGLLTPQEQKKEAKPSNTLTNSLTRQASFEQKQKLSDDESKAEAAKLLKWIE